MFKYGQRENSEVVYQSHEKRPEGFSYYNRVYNGDEIPHSEDHTSYNPPDVHHYQQSQEYPPTSPSSYPPGHIDSDSRDQFMANPDVNQYYDFNALKTREPVITENTYSKNYETIPEKKKKPYIPTFGQPREYNVVSYDGEDIINKFSDENIEYADVHLYDDFNDYGMEEEFENELRRLEDVEADDFQPSPKDNLGRVYIDGRDSGPYSSHIGANSYEYENYSDLSSGLQYTYDSDFIY